MAKSPQSHANPALIRWARESAGYSSVGELVAALPKNKVVKGDAATREKVISEWEFAKTGSSGLWEDSDQKGPTLKQLRELAKFLHRPLIAFYLPEPPEEPALPKDLRCLPDSAAEEFSPELLLLVRMAREVQSKARELMGMLGEATKASAWVRSATLNDDPRKIAARLRELLDVSESDQLEAASKSKGSSLLYWISRVESVGAIVMRRRGVEVGEFLGMALHDDLAPVILLNSNDEIPQRMSFTLLHEMAHLMLGIDGVSGEESQRWNDGSSSMDAKTEAWCNQVAGEALMPWSLVARELGSIATIDLAAIRTIATRYGVSSPVVARRMLDHGRVTKRSYEAFIRELAETWKRRPVVVPTKVEKKRGPGPDKTLPSKFGMKYLSLALGALDRNLISPGELRTYVGMNLGSKSIATLWMNVG